MSVVDPKSLRQAVGRFGTGVCVITTTQDETPIAMTVNSFSSVSLDPALVLWSIRNESGLFEAFTKGESFNINILAEDQQDLSDRCAGKTQHMLSSREYRAGFNGQPVIYGALTTLECNLWSTYEAGDHAIILGEVSALHSSDKNKPLLFFSGGYTLLGQGG